MGRRGPPKKPTALEELQGHPGHRRKNAEEPKPDLVESLAPPSRRASAETIWNEAAAELRRLNLLTVIDPRRLFRACRIEALGLRLLADAEQRRHTESKANGRQVNPALEKALRCFEAADRVWKDFGVGSPADRPRLQAPQPKGVPHAFSSGETSEPKEPHDELARRRAARTAQRDAG